MRWGIAMAAVVALAAPAHPAAHEGGVHAKGTIKAITAERLVLATAAGKEEAYALGPETKFVRGDAPAKREDVRAGERAVVHARRDGGTLRATQVRLGPSGLPSQRSGR